MFNPRQALARLLRTARTLLHAARPVPATTPPRATTLARTKDWLAALARTLAGDHTFCHPIAFPRFAGRYPSLTAGLRELLGLPALPPPTEAQRANNRLHYMRRVFTQQPTSRIATRLARRLGLTEQDEAWPHALIAITEPPARLARTATPPALRPGRKPRQPRALYYPPLRPLRLTLAPRLPRRVPQLK